MKLETKKNVKKYDCHLQSKAKGKTLLSMFLTFPRIKASISATHGPTNGVLQLVANIKLQTCKAMILLKLVHFSSGLYNLFLQNFCQLLLTFLVMSPFSAAIYKCGIRKSCCKGLMLRQKSHKELLHWYICQNCNLPNVSLQITLFGVFTKNFRNDTLNCNVPNVSLKQHCKALLLKLHFLTLCCNDTFANASICFGSQKIHDGKIWENEATCCMMLHVVAAMIHLCMYQIHLAKGNLVWGAMAWKQKIGQ